MCMFNNDKITKIKKIKKKDKKTFKKTKNIQLQKNTTINTTIKGEAKKGVGERGGGAHRKKIFVRRFCLNRLVFSS